MEEEKEAAKKPCEYTPTQKLTLPFRIMNHIDLGLGYLRTRLNKIDFK